MILEGFLPDGLSSAGFLLACLGTVCLGVAKTGFPGLAIINVLIMADLFGAKNSVGIILPMLVICDLIVFPLFRKYATWRETLPLLWPMLLAVIAAWFLLDSLDDAMARRVIGAIILFMLALQLLREYRREFLERLPDSTGFRWLSASLMGTATMLANASGPVYSLYALVHKMPKEKFLGIGARLFLLVNAFKIPLLGELHLIHAESLRINALLLPALLAGVFLGRFLIQKVPQSLFEKLLYLFSLLAGIRLLFF